MVKSAPKVLTVDEFIRHYGECDRYELIDGELIEKIKIFNPRSPTAFRRKGA
ncbi:hypothetical protein [Nostoc sp.]|uniref:hypothetical protein n=1 Tax=Nostoc sp. TaxID=1180 RepID=UPI002FFCD6D6